MDKKNKRAEGIRADNLSDAGYDMGGTFPFSVQAGGTAADQLQDE